MRVSLVSLTSVVKKAHRSLTRAACCMLWVTMTIVYSLLDLVHEVLDAAGGDRVEGRARLVHEDHLGVDGEGPGDAQPLLLTAGQAHGRRLEPVLHLVPQGGPAQRPLDDLVEARPCEPGHLRAVGDVVVDRLRERVRLLEHHADAAPHLDRVDLRVVEVDAVVA